MTATPRTPDLPTLEEIELAAYKLGSFTSDLDWITSDVKQLARGDITTIEELREREARGSIPKEKPLDRERLARLIVFACDVLEDAEVIANNAKDMQQHLLVLFHEQYNADDVRATQRIVDRWHASELQRRGGGAEGADGKASNG